MSNFTKEALYDLYSEHLPTIEELAQDANEFGISLELRISSEGEIAFVSREYFNEEKAGITKECVRVNTIEKGNDYVADSSRTQILKRERVLNGKGKVEVSSVF